MTTIQTSLRTEGMVDASASYYQESKIFHAIQNTQALEYDRVYSADEDLDLQLSPVTATWGLTFWETAVGLPPNTTGSYADRRALVLSRMLNEKTFGADTLKEMAANYGEKIDVLIDHTTATVVVVFYNGIPHFINDFQKTIEGLIHAHLGIAYQFTYKSVGGLFTGAYHALGPTIVVHPYTIGSYEMSNTIRIATNVKVSCVLTVMGRKEQ